MEYKEVWNGEYMGVRFEVVRWRLGWNYYIFLPIEQLPEDIKAKFNLRSRTYKLSDNGREHIVYDFGDAPIISDLDWHGGITFYKKTRDERGKVIGYRLGCDYMHCWDEGKGYDLGYVESEARHTVDKLWEYIPNLKLRCAWNGKYYAEAETYLTNKGIRVALENRAKWETPL